MIYFDNEKKAHSYEIENPIATTTEEIWAEFSTTDKWDIINGVFTDISNTQEYLLNIQTKQNQITKAELQKQIEELDIKRIRAIAEPSLKDETTTWLDYYTQQIQSLRSQITSL